MPDPDQKLILVAVLDWGLGHAGRIIPVVRALQGQGFSVMLASSGRAGLLLQHECPGLKYLECPAYKVRYPSRNMYRNMLLQLPHIFLTMIREHLWLRRIAREYRINGIVSDSRFGCFHPSLASVLITHQLRLVLQPNWVSRVVNWGYRHILHRFDEIWVPDTPNGLSGFLSYPSPFSSTRYIGCLSRLHPQLNAKEPEYELLVLLSGPEPQRSKLEELVVKQLKSLPHLRSLVVQGITDQTEDSVIKGTESKMVSFLAGEDLLKAIHSARIVLCRSGYSSLMDLARLGKKAILVPTPGQPEQEYLGQRCREMDWAKVVEQENLNLSTALSAAEKVNGFPSQLEFFQKLPKNMVEILKS